MSTETLEAPAAEESTEENIFSQIPDGYGQEAPTPKPAPEKKEPVEKVDPADDVDTDEPEDNQEEATEVKDEPKKKKTAAEYAEERRKQKESKQRKLQQFDELKAKNEEFESLLQSREKELEELRQNVDSTSEEQAEKEESIEVLREQIEQANKRYIAAHKEVVNPYEDAEVKKHLSGVTSALKSNIPVLATDREGKQIRTNFDVANKNPEKKQAIDMAVNRYAAAANEGNSEQMDSAVEILANALGGIDIDESDQRIKLETALNAAIDPFTAGIQRFQEVQGNQHKIALQRRAEAYKEMEDQILSPFRLDSSAAMEALEKDPDNTWAAFADLMQDVPDTFKKTIEDDLRSIALSLSKFEFSPDPLPDGATTEQIEEHQRMTAHAQQEAHGSLHYIGVAKAFIDGGLIAHLHASHRAMQKRLEEKAASEAIPSGKGGGSDSIGEEADSILHSIPSSYQK